MKARRLSAAVGRLVDRAPARLAERLSTDTRAARLLAPVLNRALPADYMAVAVRSGHGRGLRLLIDPRREKFYWTGTYELHVQEALVGVLRQGATFWDVGAHAGFFSMLAARIVGAEGRVFALEPMAANRRRLEVAVRLNDFATIEILSYAVAAHSGSTTLYEHDSSSMWTLVPERGAAAAGSVECLTLADVAAIAGRPDLIKLDVEGAEVDVLRASHDFLAGERVPLIVEMSDDGALDAARGALPSHCFDHLGSSHWLLRPS